MLKKLDIENIALVDRATIEFGPGLSVLSGETGGGKSVVVNALSLALGERADTDYIRHGTDSARIVAEFDFSRLKARDRKAMGLDSSTTDLIVERTVSRNSGSKVKINGEAATVTQLRNVTAVLVEILGQHASQRLMNEDNHLAYLDRFAHLDSERDKLVDLYERWQKTESRLRQVHSRKKQMDKERELLEFQRQEIEKAQIEVGEEDRLNAERRKLDNARALMTSAATLEQLLGADEHSVASLMGMAKAEIEKMAAMDSDLTSKARVLSAVSIEIEDLRREIEQYGGSLEDDPIRLEEVNLRLDELYGLKKKYGADEAAVLDYLKSIRSKLQEQPQSDELIGTLEAEATHLRGEYAQAAIALSEKRQTAAIQLRKGVVAELKGLAIDKGDFECAFSREPVSDGIEFDGATVRPLPHGLENARFLFTANPGEPLKSLVKTASGGEISRLLLALKIAEKKHDGRMIPTMVFDEIDAGIGGRTAGQVAEKMAQLADGCQLLVITHLHQIARQADRHYVAEKTNPTARRTLILVRQLESTEVPAEIERMVGLPAAD